MRRGGAGRMGWGPTGARGGQWAEEGREKSFSGVFDTGRGVVRAWVP